MIPHARNNNFITVVFVTLFIAFAGLSVFTEKYFLLLVPFGVLLFYAGWQMINAVFLLLLISLPFSTEYQVTATLGTDLPDELLMVCVSGLFVCYWIYLPSVVPDSIRRHPLVILLLVSFGWVILTTIFSQQPELSVKYLLAKTWYIGAFVLAPIIVFRTKQMIRFAVVALVSSMVIVVLITLARHYFYGFAFVSINDALRPFFRNHVNYSAMLVCMIPIVAVYWRTRLSKSVKIFTGIIFMALLAALFLSYARGAWLALFTGILSVWLIRKRQLVKIYVITIVVLIAALLWIRSEDRYLHYAHNYQKTIWHEDFREHLAATYQLKDVSTAERFYRWIAAVRMIKYNALTGYGPNSFYNNYKSYTIPAFKTWVSNNPEHSTVHNYFLLLTVEQGIPGLIIFLVIAGLMLFYSQRLYHRVKDEFYKKLAITTGSVIVMILTVNFLSDLIETDKIGSLFFLCMSMLIVTDINTRIPEN